MRDRLLHCVTELFEGYDIPVDVKHEILQNTLDRYDDYIREGYTEDDAFHFAVEGIGDLGEIGVRPQPESERKPGMSVGKILAIVFSVILALTIVFTILILVFSISGGSGAQSMNHGGGFGSHSSKQPEITVANVIVDDADMFSADSNDIDKIKIDWASGSVEIFTGDVSQIEFYEEAGAGSKPMVFDVTGKTLSIDFCESGISLMNFSKKLVVVVPVDWMEGKIEIDTASADVSVSDLMLSELKYDGASGDFEAEHLYCVVLDADTASGDIIMRNCEIGELCADTASGKVEAEICRVETVDANTASGKVTLDLAAAPKEVSVDTLSGAVEIGMPSGSGYTAEFDSLSGKFKSNADYKKSGDKYSFKGNGDTKISVDTASGNLTVNCG